MSPCCLQNCFTDIPLRSCAEIRVRQSSSLVPSFLATVDLVMGPLCGLANGVGRGVYRTFTSKPSHIAASIDSANSRGENPIKIISRPLPSKVRVDRDKNPTAAKREFHLEIRFPCSIALPRLLECGIVYQVAEFRYEPLHCNHPAREAPRVIRNPCVISSGSACRRAPASTDAFGQALSRRHGA